jgi:hypothetical protein
MWRVYEMRRGNWRLHGEGLLAGDDDDYAGRTLIALVHNRLMRLLTEGPVPGGAGRRKTCGEFRSGSQASESGLSVLLSKQSEVDMDRLPERKCTKSGQQSH